MKPRRTKKKKKTEIQLFRECLRKSEALILLLLAFGFSASYVTREACREYEGTWTNDGLDLADREVNRKFVHYCQKTLWRWRHNPKKLRPFVEQRDALAKANGLWLHDPTARVVRLQNIVERVENKDYPKHGDLKAARVLVDLIKQVRIPGTAATEQREPIGFEITETKPEHYEIHDNP